MQCMTTRLVVPSAAYRNIQHGLPKISRSQNDISVCTQGVSETIEIHYVTGGDRHSLLGNCDWLGARLRYAHSYPVLGQKSIPVRACPIGPELSTPAAVTRGGGVGGKCAAISASDADSIYSAGLCMHVVGSRSVRCAYIGMHPSLPDWHAHARADSHETELPRNAARGR